MESTAGLSRTTQPEPALPTSSSSSPALPQIPPPTTSSSGHTSRFHPRVVMWVDNMAGSAPSYQDELSSLCRPERIGGLGAKIIPKATKSFSSDPVERKLQRKLNVIKKKSAQDPRKTSPVEENGLDEDDEDEEPESKVKAFTKRRAQLASQVQRPAKKVK